MNDIEVGNFTLVKHLKKDVWVLPGIYDDKNQVIGNRGDALIAASKGALECRNLPKSQYLASQAKS